MCNSIDATVLMCWFSYRAEQYDKKVWELQLNKMNKTVETKLCVCSNCSPSAAIHISTLDRTSRWISCSMEGVTLEHSRTIRCRRLSRLVGSLRKICSFKFLKKGRKEWDQANREAYQQCYHIRQCGYRVSCSRTITGGKGKGSLSYRNRGDRSRSNNISFAKSFNMAITILNNNVPLKLLPSYHAR